MGSFEEFKAAVAFIDKHQIVPVVHSVSSGLENAEEQFVAMRNGVQFGKLVVEIGSGSGSKL